MSWLLRDCLLCGSVESQHRLTKENQQQWIDDFCKLYDVETTYTGTGKDQAELLQIQDTLRTANYCFDCLSELRSITAIYKTIENANAQLKVIQLQCESKLKSCLKALQVQSNPHVKRENKESHTEDEREAEGDELQHNYLRKQQVLKCMQKRYMTANQHDDDVDEEDDDMGQGSLSADEDDWRRRCNKLGSSSQVVVKMEHDAEEGLIQEFKLEPELTYSDDDDDEDQDYASFSSSFMNTDTLKDGTPAIFVPPVTHFPCTREGCLESFKFAVDLEEHVKRIHEGLKYPFPCDTCGKPCYSYSKLQDHQNIHNGLTPYECPDPYCRKKFATRFMLTCHMRTKKIQRGRPAPPPQPQPPPPDQFELLAQLDLAPILSNDSTSQHEASQLILTMLQRKQQEDEAESTRKSLALTPRKRQPRKDLDLPFQFSCPYPECTKQFRKEVQREGHIKADHEKSIKYPFPCELCSKPCYSYEKLVQHANIHLGIKPYPCPDPNCGKSFATEQLLYFHCRRKNIRAGSMSGSQSQSTSQAPNMFEYSFSAQAEAEDDKADSMSNSPTQTQIPRRRQPRKDLDLPFQFRCTYPECLRQFRKESQREGHIKVDHEKSIKYPFPCDLCSKPCYTYEKLRQHANVHQGITPYQCPDPGCGKKFATEQLLYYHRRSKSLRKKRSRSTR